MLDSNTASTILQFRQVGQIALRRIDGHEQLPAFLAKEWSQAA